MVIQSTECCIAVIGVAGSFPGAADHNGLWRNLRDGVDSIVRMPCDRRETRNRVRAIAALSDYQYFDAGFFGMPPSEAQLLDPQHRVFLECCWSAMEDAGYIPSHDARTGVFAGCAPSTYLTHNIVPRSDILQSIAPAELIATNGADFLTTRISYGLNLKGPSYCVQCACSTSLVAVHLASKSLADYKCELALAGGSSVNVKIMDGYQYSDGEVTSQNGYCCPFDARAGGPVFGSGVGAVLLKRLEDALADRDHIYAIILGSAVNNDGGEKTAYTTPSVDGEAEVIEKAIAAAGIKPTDISYVECHGTGSPLGDATEVRALEKVFGNEREARCAVGSIKGNVGHLDAAAGITGLIKVAMGLRHRQLVPTLHFERANPEIDFSTNGLYVNTELKEWACLNGPRRAGVSAFGLGGTNAHVILQEAPEQQESGESRQWQLLLCSGKNAEAETEVVRRLVRGAKERDLGKLADAAYTLAVGRQRFGFRRAVLCHDWRDGIEKLERNEWIAKTDGEEGSIDIGMLFPGQGSQIVGMGGQLYASEATFRREMDKCAEIVRAETGRDLREAIYEGSSTQLQQTALTQPALFATEYALARLWRSWGIEPKVTFGHSLGEYVSACLAGVMRLEDALHLLRIRGQLMESMEPGKMAAVEATESELSSWLGDGLWLAAVNAARLCTVSGNKERVDKFCREWLQRKRMVQPLRTSHAFHSPLMKPMADEFVEEVTKISLQSPTVRYISNVTGGWIGDECRNPNYWGQQLLRPVRFADGVNTLLTQERLALIEVGPGRQLTRLIHADNKDARVFPSLDVGSEQQSMLRALGQLWCAGANISWTGFYESQRRHRIPLPTYPFERKRYWIDPPTLPFANPVHSH